MEISPDRQLNGPRKTPMTAEELRTQLADINGGSKIFLMLKNRRVPITGCEILEYESEHYVNLLINPEEEKKWKYHR